ncbi:MAG TPA: hypothetical protein VE987_04610, partial [Polyangiaceae bacterium]|nr:hypothetical protein [Polyangiaceae bacterium]
MLRLMRYALSLPGWVIALAVSGLGVACRAADPAVDSAGSTVPVAAAGGGAACGPGRAGCPCDGAGASAECGSTVGHYGDYVTCAMGRSYCQDGKWTACLDTTLVTKSLGKTTIGSGGLRVLSSPLPCQDACDPYMCNLLGSSAADVDAAGVTAAADGSVTLAPSSTAPPCTGLQCQVAQDCPPGTTTTLTGTVHDPAGVNPVYNAFVYVPVDPSGQLPPFTAGPTCDTCSGAAIQAVSIAQTAFDGTFVLSNVPSTDVAPGSQIPLVVQVGEWRREVMLTSVPKCQATAIDPDSSRLPRHRFDGFGSQADLPNMAIATGTSDAIECLLLKIGIDPREFQVPGTGASRIDFYDANGLDFNAPAGATKPVAPGLAVLASNLNQYDVVILPC